MLNAIVGGILQIVKDMLNSRIMNWSKIGHKLGNVIDCKCNIKLNVSDHMDETIDGTSVGN
jgi:hypothetical protein